MKSYARKRRSTPYKRRYIVKRRRPRQNRMQRAAFSVVKKKYTFVTPLRVAPGDDQVSGVISHIGGRNSTNPVDTIQLNQVDPDTMASIDMGQYQFFRITGVAFKLFFPEGTTPESTPVQWSLAYSANKVLNPNLTAAPLQTLATYQTSGCSARQPVKRYFRTATTLKRLGIDWCSTDEYVQFGANPPIPLYGE